MQFIDTHVHLTDDRFKDDIEKVIDNAVKNSVKTMINIGADLDTSKKAVYQTKMHDMLYSAVGFHPHGAKNIEEKDYLELIELLSEDKVLAIGEIGLDYHYDFSPRKVQQEVFKKQMEIAKMYKYAVVIHNRESHEDVYNTLKEFEGEVSGIMHCYSGSYDMAKRFIDLDYYISIAGPITFKNARKLPDVVKGVPLDRLLIETDCPYLAPTPYRGKRNEPAYVVEVAKKIAEIRNMSLEEVAEVTTRNAQKAFRFEVS